MAKKAKAVDNTNYLAPYEFHGLIFANTTSNQAKTDCPFCGKENHFFVSTKSGMFQCKVCGEKGNTYSYLALLLQRYNEPENATLGTEKLSELRKLPEEAFLSWGIGYDPTDKRFYIPSYNEEGKLNGLNVWDGPGKKIYPTTGMKHSLGRGYLLDRSSSDFDPSAPVYILESLWNTIALEWLRSTLTEPGIIVYTSGANVFKDDWKESFRGRDVYLLDDNDKGGEEGIKLKTEKLNGIVRSLHRIRWNKLAKGLKSGYDVNDYVSERVRSPRKAWKELLACFEPIQVVEAKEAPEDGAIEVEFPPVKPWVRSRKGKPPSIDTLLKEYQKCIHLNSTMKDAIKLGLATIVSIAVPGDPLWIYLVGPPGAGKTLFCESFETCEERVVNRDQIRPRDLVSGFVPPDGSDPSLLPLIAKKTLVVKDFTTIKKMSTPDQDAIYGVLTSAYDGRYRAIYANKATRIYNDCHFSFIACVTDIIHADNRSSVGERFVKVEFLGEDNDNDKHIMAAMDARENPQKNAEQKAAIRVVVEDFLDRTIDSQKLPAVPLWMKQRIVSLVQIVAYMRASVEKSHHGDLHFRTRTEVGTRLSSQLITLGKCLAIILDKKTVDQECYRLLEKVAFDTAYGWHLDIVRVMVKAGRPLKKKDLARMANISDSSLGRKLDNLLELKAVLREEPEPVKETKAKSFKKAGQPAELYRVHPHLVDLWRKAKIDI